MANIILPEVNILNEINDSATMLVEQNGEINRFNIADLDIGGGDVTINLEDSNISKPNPVNADTLGGIPASDYVTRDEIGDLGTSVYTLRGKLAENYTIKEQLDIIEAQVTYTALMTDTLLEV